MSSAIASACSSTDIQASATRAARAGVTSPANGRMRAPSHPEHKWRHYRGQHVALRPIPTVPAAQCATCALRPRWCPSQPGLRRTPMEATGFSMQDVTVTFGGLTALTDVSLTARPHEVLGVIGPNGAGKTTLFNVACGFVTPDSGSLRWRGEELRRLRPHDLAGLGIARTLQ